MNRRERGFWYYVTTGLIAIGLVGCSSADISASYIPTPVDAGTDSLFPGPDWCAGFIDGHNDGPDGVYYAGQSYRVLEQPMGSPAYVFNEDVTQFGLAKKYGTTAFLAHNFTKEGSNMLNLDIGETVYTCDDHLGYKKYEITSIRTYRALTPTNTNSEFIDLQNPNVGQLSASDLFNSIYKSGGIVFQTCIEAEGNPSWGRIFYIGQEVEN